MVSGNPLVRVPPLTAFVEGLQDRRGRAHEPRGLLGEHGLTDRTVDPQSEAALVGDHGAHARVGHELLHEGLLPGLGAQGVLMKKVPPAFELDPVDLNCKAQDDRAFG